MSNFIYASVLLKHPHLSKEKVAARCIVAASIKGYRPLKGEYEEGKTRFIVYGDGTFEFGYINVPWESREPSFLSLEEFEKHCYEVEKLEGVGMSELIKLAQEWGKDRGITDPHKQLLKTLEELGELSSSLLKGKRDDEIDAVGDVLICLSIYCDIRNINMREALELGYRTIANRTGKTVDGCFVKDEE